LKITTKLLLAYLFFSLISFSIIIIWVNQSIEDDSFIAIEKQMMEKADISELTFREILSRYEKTATQEQSADMVKEVLDALKASGREVRIYDGKQTLLGFAKNGIVVTDSAPKVFSKNIVNALEGNYAYTITDQNLIYFAMPIQDMFYQNAYVFEIVEDISYYYEIMDKIRSLLIVGAGGFIVLITLSSLFMARKSTKPIKALLNAQKQFVSNVSHELRTPLAAIRGFSQYLYDGENDVTYKKIYAHLVTESNRLTVLIDELLLLSKFDKTSEVLGTERVDLSSLTASVIQEMRPKSEAKGLFIKANLSLELGVAVNKILMSHAISNIIDNAIKYSTEGTMISIATSKRDNTAFLTISDQGIGINKNDLPLVQKRFYRAENAHVARGSGLGLSLCREIVEKFDGELTIESEIGEGTVVTLSLPLA
jgi:signal transduction histidine kinase